MCLCQHHCMSICLHTQNKTEYHLQCPVTKRQRIKKDLLSLDVTELSATENLIHPGEYVLKAQELLSNLYGSDKSYILTGGSTSAIQSMICAGVKPGGTLLSAGDCHMSVINTCALLGINLKLFPKEIDNSFSVPKGTGTLKNI